MKKKGILLSVLLVFCMLLSPLSVYAGSKIEPTDAQGNTVDEEGNPIVCQKNTAGTTATCYASITVDEGDTVNSFKFTATLNNLKYTSVRGMNNWTVEAVDNNTTVDYTVTKAEGLSGKKEVAVRMTFSVPNAGEECSIVLSAYTPGNEQPTENPKCQVKDGKYYCENGAECTKEDYDKNCTTSTENPKTGSFMPYAVIIAGVAVASGLYFLTKKNKIYHM